MKISFERVTALEYRLKAAQAKIRAFESGEKYVQMEKKFKALLREKERIIQELTAELARSHTENISIRNQWFDVFEEMEKEYERKFKALMRRNEQLEKRALKAERKLDEANKK